MAIETQRIRERKRERARKRKKRSKGHKDAKGKTNTEILDSREISFPQGGTRETEIEREIVGVQRESPAVMGNDRDRGYAA